MVGKGVLWRGTYYVKPQAASFVDSSNLSTVQLGSDNRVVIMGDMVGVIPPKTLMSITPSTAKEILHPSNEEARLACDLVFSPSKGGTLGASQVYLLATNPSENASLTTTGYVLSSYMYGYAANQISVKQESDTSGKKVTVVYEGNIESFRYIEKESFSIQYTGSGSACAMTIDIAEGTGHHKLTTSCTGASADDLVLDFAIYTTIQSLVDAINATGKYDATVLTSRPKVDLCMQLDSCTATAIKASAATVKSDLQAIVDTINARSGYLQATRVADAGAAPTNFDTTFLSGGTDGTTASDDWIEAFDVLKTADIQVVLPLTSDEDILLMADAHCQYMSGPIGKNERVFFFGTDNQTWTSAATRLASVTAISATAKLINSDRGVYAGLGSYHYDAYGNLKLYPGYITAAMYAGIAAGANSTVPITRKYLNCVGLETDLRIDEINELIEAGAAVPIPDVVQGAGYVVSRGVTTWSGDDDLLKIELSVRRGCDYIAKEVRNRHELLVGKPGTEAIDATIINVTNAVLQAAKKAEMIRSYDPKATQLRAEGTIRYVDYSAVPILPINFIFSTFHLQPLNVTITL